MLFRNALFLSVFLTSAYATSIHPLLFVRQNLTQCASQCDPVVQQFQGNSCDIKCICTAATINSVASCVTCATNAGLSIPGVGPNFVQQLLSDCSSAGYPVTGVSGGSGGSSGGSTGGGAGGSTLGSSASGGLGGSTATNTGLGGGSLTTPAASTTTSPTSGGNGGLPIVKNGASGLTAQLGVVAAIAGVAAVLVV